MHNFNEACQKYIMKTAEQKAKSITISHGPLGCKVVINDRIIEQVMQVDNIGTRLANNNKAYEEIERCV